MLIAQSVHPSISKISEIIDQINSSVLSIKLLISESQDNHLQIETQNTYNEIFPYSSFKYEKSKVESQSILEISQSQNHHLSSFPLLQNSSITRQLTTILPSKPGDDSIPSIISSPTSNSHSSLFPILHQLSALCASVQPHLSSLAVRLGCAQSRSLQLAERNSSLLSQLAEARLLVQDLQAMRKWEADSREAELKESWRMAERWDKEAEIERERFIEERRERRNRREVFLDSEETPQPQEIERELLLIKQESNESQLKSVTFKPASRQEEFEAFRTQFGSQLSQAKSAIRSELELPKFDEKDEYIDSLMHAYNSSTFAASELSQKVVALHSIIAQKESIIVELNCSLIQSTEKLNKITAELERVTKIHTLTNQRFCKMLFDIGNNGQIVREVMSAANDEHNSANLSSLLNFSGKTPRGQKVESENDEVIIGLETQENQRNYYGSYDGYRADLFNENEQSENINQIEEFNFSDKLYDIELKCRNQEAKNTHLTYIAKTLFVKSINLIKDSRQAITVILGFLNILESIEFKDISDYLTNLKQSLREQKIHFVSKLEYLRTEVDEIQALNQIQ